ncbi:MAG: iodotyrosine deiodinase [Candidatus Krumholzibacteriia bacterium]|jgi:iodotyrosine deiodinase
MSSGKHLPFSGLPEMSAEESLAAAKEFHDLVASRRTVREYSDLPVSEEVIRECVIAAGQAPSGANMQPWHFEIVGDPAIKKQIRMAAEAEEREFYEGRASDEWLEALAPLGTDADKPFLETAPWLIVIFEQRHGLTADGQKVRYYYTKESVGLAAGFLIAALHKAGLATLTHTPSPMGFLNKILERPSREKPFLLLVAGHPAADATVPDISRKDPSAYLHFRT